MTGPFDEQSSVAREEKEKQIERLLVLIEADYDTFKLQYEVEHPEAVNTLNWVIAYLSELRDLRF
jgi:hypothetical protein